jgi:hypothetical protein
LPLQVNAYEATPLPCLNIYRDWIFVIRETASVINHKQ